MCVISGGGDDEEEVGVLFSCYPLLADVLSLTSLTSLLTLNNSHSSVDDGDDMDGIRLNTEEGRSGRLDERVF